jgi:hypothetical protein
MSFWGSVGNAFKDAWDSTEGVADKIALATANGVNVFANGWKDVFSGDFQQGIHNIAAGLFLTLGVPPEPPVQGSQLDEALGSAALWSLQQYTANGSSTELCFSIYAAHVKSNFAALGITWVDTTMDVTLQQGAANFPWINMNC